MAVVTFFAVSSAVAHNVAWTFIWAAVAVAWTGLYHFTRSRRARRARKNGA
jgi:hypothetical protein